MTLSNLIPTCVIAFIMAANSMLLDAQANQKPEPGNPIPTGNPMPKPPGHGALDLAVGPPPDKPAVARGQKLFVASCGFCHGSNAAGGNGGPNLVRSVLVLHDKGTAAEVGPVILNGRTTKGMPKFAYSSDQVRDLAQFLLFRVESTANRMDYTIQNIVTGDPHAGEAYFQTHCVSCHSPTGDLAHIAQKYEPVDLQNKFLNPRAGHSDDAGLNKEALQKKATVTLPTGEQLTGKLTHIDDFRISILAKDGSEQSWSLDESSGVRVQVNDPLQGHLALLPLYTDSDMHNVLAFLETLK